MLNKTTKYAIRALLYLKQSSSGNYMKITALANKLNIPSSYLAKILKRLEKHNIIESKVGRSGGIRLNCKNSISFYQIAKILNDSVIKDSCILTLRPCIKKSPCQYHCEWKDVKEHYLKFLYNAKI